MPPEANVEQTDWSIDAAPEASIDRRSAEESEVTEFSNSELDRIRKQLEGLL